MAENLSAVSKRQSTLKKLIEIFEAVRFKENPEEGKKNQYTVSIVLAPDEAHLIERRLFPHIQIIDGRESDRRVSTPTQTLEYTLRPVIRLVDAVNDDEATRGVNDPTPYEQMDAHIERVKRVHIENPSFGGCNIWKMPTIQTTYDPAFYLAEIFFDNELDVYTSYNL